MRSVTCHSISGVQVSVNNHDVWVDNSFYPLENEICGEVIRVFCSVSGKFVFVLSNMGNYILIIGSKTAFVQQNIRTYTVIDCIFSLDEKSVFLLTPYSILEIDTFSSNINHKYEIDIPNSVESFRIDEVHSVICIFTSNGSFLYVFDRETETLKAVTEDEYPVFNFPKPTVNPLSMKYPPPYPERIQNIDQAHELLFLRSKKLYDRQHSLITRRNRIVDDMTSLNVEYKEIEGRIRHFENRKKALMARISGLVSSIHDTLDFNPYEAICTMEESIPKMHDYAELDQRSVSKFLSYRFIDRMDMLKEASMQQTTK